MTTFTFPYRRDAEATNLLDALEPPKSPPRPARPRDRREQAATRWGRERQ